MESGCVHMLNLFTLKTIMLEDIVKFGSIQLSLNCSCYSQKGVR